MGVQAFVEAKPPKHILPFNDRNQILGQLSDKNYTIITIIKWFHILI